MTNDHSPWLAALIDALDDIVGERVAEAWVWEMALYGPDDAPVFEHPDLRFAQALVLELRLASGETLHVSTWQDDDTFALRIERVPTDRRLDAAAPQGAIFRVRQMPDFPLGVIGHVAGTIAERGRISEIAMTIEGSDVVLVAGEVYEDGDGVLSVSDRDESVLVFLSEADRAATVFNTPHYRIG